MDKLNLFYQYLHTMLAETINYNLNLVNEGSNNAIIINNERNDNIAGGIVQSDLFAYTPDLIRRRNPNGNAPLVLKNLENKMDNAIRLAFTTELLNLSKNIWYWIDRDPAIAARKFADMLVTQRIEEYLKRVFSVLKATVGSNPATLRDVTAATDPAKRGVTYTNLALTANKFGDAASQLKTFIMPTNARTELLINNLNNANQLFSFGTVNAYRDAEGRTIITSDDPNLTQEGGVAPDQYLDYWTFGLRQNAIRIKELDDFEEAKGTTTGQENIQHTYQANWSVLLDVMGYKYDAAQLTGEANKFASASDAAIASSLNWSQVMDNHKTTAGVALKARAGDDL